MAKLWRVMNAPALHLIEHDDGGNQISGYQSAESVSEISRELDIPLQLSGRFSDPEVIDAWLERGIHRIILEPQEDIETVHALCNAQCPGRVIPSLSLEDTESPDPAYGELPCRRLFVWLPRRLTHDHILRLRVWGEVLPGVRFTVANGISSYEGILELESLEPYVDSLVLGKPLYENAFPCQQFWCWNQKESVDLDQYSTAPLAS